MGESIKFMEKLQLDLSHDATRIAFVHHARIGIYCLAGY